VNDIFRYVEAPAPRYMMRLHLLDRLFDMLKNPVNAFAEIGPGRGDVSAYIARRSPAADATLYEYSPAGFDHLTTRFANQPQFCIKSTDFMHDEVTSAFDMVMAFEVLEHIEHDVDALAHIHQMLRPPGHIVLSVPAYMRRWQAVDRYAGHVRRYERDELQNKLQNAGFDIRAMWMYGFPITELLFPLRELYYRFMSRNDDGDKQAATQKSGIERPLATRLNPRVVATALAPFFAIQWRARATTLGDGFLVLAERRS
jgi:SAM-dependent methyltransferase